MNTFDRFADKSSSFVSKAPFFAFCCLLIIIWAPSYFLFGSIDSWQLVINSVTTVITFILVALLQNSQKRFEDATSIKLNAIADLLADFGDVHPDLDPKHVAELRRVMGIEKEI